MPPARAISSAPPVFAFRKTRSGCSFSPWDADRGVPLHAPAVLDYDALLQRSLEEKARITNNGRFPHEDEPDLDPQPVDQQVAASSASPDVPSLPSPFSSPLASLARPSRSPSPAPGAPPHVEQRPPIGSQPSRRELTKAEFHKRLQVEQYRAKRKLDRAKKQRAAGESVKAACKKYRSSAPIVHTKFALVPDNVHVASSSVIGRAMHVRARERKPMTLQDANKLGFEYVTWSGRCV
ncbi:hypothetical protein L227DRAFT_618143 [Lentinus tigrinus ALCF2SS1-6]|uniref:Uncharacterized protein n=1 Tax=Lentinus tigrinus ALCF2SS1-6 TaxID=1328759 RepID=A0A5C2RKG9_9APHY|nr:hypothetical protein L227DRAFT_618143 [Lentinus tigrinus ALCF2SS1-6]